MIFNYWNFESAAIADILSVEISPFEDNKYFPKDAYFTKKVELKDRIVNKNSPKIYSFIDI